MGFFSFLGRVLFASIFILSAWQIVSPLDSVTFFPNTTTNIAYSRFNEFGKDGGPTAKEWTPKLARVKRFFDGIVGKNNYHIDARTFVALCIFLKGLGGLLFVFGSTFGAYLLVYYLILTTPLLYDFYNYNPTKPQYFRLLNEFLQCVALGGALLFFLGMKDSISRKQPKKRTPKPKAA